MIQDFSLFNSHKICIISDLHLGIHQNSFQWHSNILNFSEYLKTKLNKLKIKDILILGDFFHDRNEINVSTMDCASKFLDNLEKFNIVMITGNHDCFYKDSSEIHSLSLFKNHKNVHVYDSFFSFKQFDRNFCLVPWGTTIENDSYDYIFGHFELNGFKFNNFKVCEHGSDVKQYLDIGKNVISGHFHHRDEKIIDRKRVLYVGSPYQMDFGDCGDERGFTILDLKNELFEFYPSEESPKFLKITEKEIEKIENLKEFIKNNVIKLTFTENISDKKQEDNNLKLITKLESYKPNQLSVEYDYSNLETIDNGNLGNDIKFDTFKIDSSIDEYIDVLEIENKHDIKNYVKECFSRC